MGVKLEEFELLIAICDNDMLKAYSLCERFGGINLHIPKKSHKNFFAKLLLQRGVPPKDIIKDLQMSKSQVYRLREEVLSAR